jgi:hypothetical protein
MAYCDRFVTSYLDPLQVDVQMAQLAAEFPDLCRLEGLPHLSHGYAGRREDARRRHPMRVLRITAPDGPVVEKPAVLLMRSPTPGSGSTRWPPWRPPGN